MWYVKNYNELELDELEQILGLRQDIFILEQESFFRDIDGKDKDSMHLFKKTDSIIRAYCRMEVGDKVLISRVVVNPKYRGNGMGRELFKYAVDYAREQYPEKQIQIIAMAYLLEFYESYGFKVISDEYDIAGHNHIDMVLTP